MRTSSPVRAICRRAILLLVRVAWLTCSDTCWHKRRVYIWRRLWLDYGVIQHSCSARWSLLQLWTTVLYVRKTYVQYKSTWVHWYYEECGSVCEFHPCSRTKSLAIKGIFRTWLRLSWCYTLCVKSTRSCKIIDKKVNFLSKFILSPSKYSPSSTTQ